MPESRCQRLDDPGFEENLSIKSMVITVWTEIFGKVFTLAKVATALESDSLHIDLNVTS